MIALRLGALVVSLPTVEQAVELVALLGLSGRFPMPEIAEVPELEPAAIQEPVVESLRAARVPVREPRPMAPRRATPAAPAPAPKAQPLPDVDGALLRAFGKDERYPLHELARQLFPDRPAASGIRLLKLRLVALEGSGQVHRVGAGAYRAGPSPRLTKRPGRPRRSAADYEPEHSFDDAVLEDSDGDPEELDFGRLDAL